MNTGKISNGSAYNAIDGGDAMAAVKDYVDGNARIRIDDEFCVKSEEEIDEILKRVGKIYIDCLAKTEPTKNDAEIFLKN